MHISENITKLIDKDAYPQDVIKAIKILSLNKDNPAHIFGSYSYKRQLYAQDIDLLETDIEDINLDNAVNKLEAKLNVVFGTISNTPGFYFSEFKAGLDERYNINVGELVEGIFTRVNPVQFMQKIMLLSNQGLINKKDIDTLFNIYNKVEVTADDYDIAFNILRNYRVLRWTLPELLEGKKRLKGGLIMTLNQALHYNSTIKIDLISYIDNRFVEVTNFIIFVLKKGDELIVLNDKQNAITNIKQNTVEGLQKEIDKVFFSTMFFNPFKGIKRLWSLGRQYNDLTMIQYLNTIISGDISSLYQKKGNIDTIINVYEKYVEKSPVHEMMEELDNIKIELDRIITFDITKIIQKYNELVNMAINNNLLFADLVIGLENISKMMSIEIAYQTMSWLINNNFSIPVNYLPNTPKYYNEGYRNNGFLM